MRAVALVCLFLSSVATAAIYENFSDDVDEEEDLFALEQRGDISEETRDTLLELLREGIDLNTASRDQLYDLPGLTYEDCDAVLAYRQEKGAITDPAELVTAGALTSQQLMQIAPFLRIGAVTQRAPFSGRMRLVTQFMATDNVAPPAVLLGDFKGPYDLSAGGLIATTRRDLAPARYDPSVDTLVTTQPYLPHVPRAYIQWKSGDKRVGVGTFTLGFAERLVLDNTRRRTPHGIYLTNDFRRQAESTRTCKLSGGDIISGGCADNEQNLYITPDFSWRDSFRGIAASIENIQLGGEKSLSMYGFSSFQGRGLYQYELYDRRTCDDPTVDECDAPVIYQDQGANTGSTRYIFSSLSYLYDELAAGGHVELNTSYATRIGITGYGAVPFFRDAGPMELGFRNYSRWPDNGAYGAIGIDGRAVVGPFNFFIEAARSFDRTPGNQGGGWGIEQRTTLSLKKQELEVSLRYYDNHFANPYARPIAGPDKLDGQRARNELGAQVRYYVKPNRDWMLRAGANFWVLPFTNPRQGLAGTANLYGLMRFDLTTWPIFEPSVWVDARNRDLSSTVRGGCSPGTIILTEGEPSECNGDYYRVVLRGELRPLNGRRSLQITTQGALTWRDDMRAIFRIEQRFRQDVQAWLEVRAQFVEWLSVRVRSRYLFQDITDNAYLEHSLWSILEVAVMPVKGTRLAVRYDNYAYFDTRESTLTRVPNPEHRFLIDLRTSF